MNGRRTRGLSARVKTLLRAAYRHTPGKQRLFERVRASWSPPESVYRHLHFEGIIDVPVPGGAGFRMRHYGYQVENSVFWAGLTGEWERVSLGLWLELSREASMILDVGANTGVYGLAAKAQNPSARVVAVEPVRRVFDKLVTNVKLNGFDIQCLDVAASDADGLATIFDTDSEHTYSVTVNRNVNAPGVVTIPTEVRTARIESLAREHSWPRIDLMKVDVETHEVEVLRGMGGLLAKDRPTMLIEVLDDEVGRGIESAVEGLGYVYFNVDERSTARRVAHIGRSDYYNFLLCTPERAARLRLL